MLRSALRGLLLVVIAGVAMAQGAPINVGTFPQGSVQTAQLMAENASCTQPLNFRFNFEPNSWLQPQGSNEVLGVQRGQSVPLPVLIDLRQRQPGQHVTRVTVECLNCGVLFIRNCTFDQQQLVLAVNVAPQVTAQPPQPQPQPQPAAAQPTAPAATSPAIDQASMADLTGPQRAALEGARDRAAAARAAAAAADAALEEARRRKRRCEDELSAQAHAAAAAQAAADAAAATASAAAQQASDAQAQVAANEAALSAAQGAIAHRQEAVQIQINYLNLVLQQDGPNSQRVQNARQYVRDQEAQLAAAQQAIRDAEAAVAASQAAAAQAAANAAAAQAAAAAAQAEASAAAAALTAKERECLGLGEAETAAAGAASSAAGASAGANREEEEAERDAAAQAAQNLQDEIERCRRRCQECIDELAAMFEAQLRAMEALAQLGLLNPGGGGGPVEQVTTMDQVLSVLGDVGEGIVTEVLPELAARGGGAAPDFGVDTVLGALQAGYGILSIRQDMLAPEGSTAGSAHVSNEERIDWLEEQGFAENAEQAEDVLDWMENFMEHGRSTENMTEQLERKRAECAYCRAELAALEARAGQ